MATERVGLLCEAPTLDTGAREAEHWTDREVDESVFKDARLSRRFHELLKQMGAALLIPT